MLDRLVLGTQKNGGRNENVIVTWDNLWSQSLGKASVT